MGQFKAYKIKREALRIVRQIGHARQFSWEYATSTRFYDRFQACNTEWWEGAGRPSSRIAIYVIYPDAGLLASHLRCIEYLSAKGLAVLTLSNLPLGEADRTRVLEKSWIYAERPNVGYDFGAYRDGVKYIADRLPTLDQLVLMNDSTWFPLPGSRDWLADVAALDVDFTSAASHFGLERANAEDFRKQEWQFSTEHRNFHYASFALAFSARVLRDPRFLKFWDNYILTNNKTRTVRRGEIGLTKFAMRCGFTHGSTLDVVGLLDVLDGLSADRLQEVAEQLILITDPPLKKEKSRVLGASAALDRDTAIRLAMAGVARQGASYALAGLLVHDLGFPFLKKSPLWISPETSDISLGIIEGLPGPDGEMILSEARQLRSRKANSFQSAGTQSPQPAVPAQ
ncbi:MAG: rhamnan synthesis F family protein [Pseudomonadota bacterium]